MGSGHGLDQLFRREVEPHVHLVAGLGHEIEAGGRDLLGDEDPTHV